MRNAVVLAIRAPPSFSSCWGAPPGASRTMRPRI